MVVSVLARRSLSPHSAIFSPCLPLIFETLSRIFPPFPTPARVCRRSSRRFPAHPGYCPTHRPTARACRARGWGRRCRISADRLPVDDLDAVGALLLVDLAIVTYQLAVVLVGRDHEDLVTRLDAFLRQRADHVVGLVTLDFEDRDAHRFQHTLDIGDGQEDVLGRVGTVGLVLGRYLPAEAAALGVERHAQQVGPLSLLDVAQELYEAESHGGIHAGPVAHGTPRKA